jgi:hypothetical protein
LFISLVLIVHVQTQSNVLDVHVLDDAKGKHDVTLKRTFRPKCAHLRSHLRTRRASRAPRISITPRDAPCALSLRPQRLSSATKTPNVST